MDKSKDWLKYGGIGFLCGCLVLGSFFVSVRLTQVSASEDRYDELQVFARVINIINSFYVEEVDTKKLIQGAIKGMLQSLDPHTNYLPEEIFRELQNETAGRFGGVGIEITVKDNNLTVISAIEDTPAWKAGIKPGDVILEIDGYPTQGLSLAEAGQRMRGKRGSTVKLTIGREGQEDRLDLAIRRETIRINSVKYTDLGHGIGYFKLTSFIEESGRDLEKELQRHKKNSGGEIRGAILDLRRNPGGLLDQAVEISDLFLESGTIVSTVGRDRNQQEITFAKKATDFLEFPLIVLINESSASASEIVAGALRDNGRAVVMGTPSFGKGSVQSIIQLGDGSGLKLTVARYYTPRGTSIQAEGIVPDIYLDDIIPDSFEKVLSGRAVQRERDIRGHLEGESRGKAKTPEAGPSPLSLSWAVEAGKKKKPGPFESLLSSDYQLLQAYNYMIAMSRD